MPPVNRLPAATRVELTSHTNTRPGIVQARRRPESTAALRQTELVLRMGDGEATRPTSNHTRPATAAFLFVTVSPERDADVRRMARNPRAAPGRESQTVPREGADRLDSTSGLGGAGFPFRGGNSIRG